MAREKTNSITRLVKILAEEVVVDKLESSMINIVDIVHKKVYDQIKMDMKNSKNAEKVRKALDRQGELWDETEVRLLKLEIREAIKGIAENHSRTEGAIKSRIRQEGYIDGF